MGVGAMSMPWGVRETMGRMGQGKGGPLGGPA